MTPRVELIHFEGCPHAAAARQELRRALEQGGLEPQWSEWDTGADNTPEGYRGFGSPTVLIDGEAVGGGTPGSGMGCAVGGAPSAEAILALLQRSS